MSQACPALLPPDECITAPRHVTHPMYRDLIPAASLKVVLAFQARPQDKMKPSASRALREAVPANVRRVPDPAISVA
jgi:hypothetical protein